MVRILNGPDYLKNRTPFEYGTLSTIQIPNLFGIRAPTVFEWSTKSLDFTIWILNIYTVWYSDESDIQVFGIQMFTV